MATNFPAQLKVALAPPDDTDPPTNPTWTRDNIIGINPPIVIVKDLPTPYDYGAVGDGAEDDTLAYQTWLTAIGGNSGYGAPGTFLVSSLLTIKSGTTIYGSGRATHILKKHSSFPAGQQMMINTYQPSLPGVYVDTDIALYGMCFDGSNLVSNNPLLHLSGVLGVVVRDCAFQHNQYMLTAFAGCGNVTVDSNRLSDWGRVTFDQAAGSGLREGGPAIWLNAGANGECVDCSITNNRFDNGRWGGLSTTAQRLTVAGNHFNILKEYGIAGNPQRAMISGNQFEAITLNDVTNHGIKTGGQDVSIIGNTLTDMGGYGIHVMDGVRYTVADNIVLRPQREAAVPNTEAGIKILSAAGSSVIDVHDNTVSDPSGRTAFGILFSAPSVKITDMQCKGNVLPPPWAATGIAFYPDAATAIGARCMVRDNGAPDQDWSRSAIKFAIASGTTGSFVVAGVGFKPSSIDFNAVRPAASGNLAASLGHVGWVTTYDIVAQAITVARANQVGSAISVATNGTNCFGASSTRCINITDSSGTDVCAADITSIDADGFTLTIDGTTTADVDVIAMCHC